MLFVSPLLALALFAGTVPPSPQVDPGQVLRWSGAAIDSCALGERTWAPRDNACLYPVDLLVGDGPLVLERSRAGRHETRTVRVNDYPFPIQRLTLPKHMVDLSPKDLARVERETAQIEPLWDIEGPARFALPLGSPLSPLPKGSRFGSRRIINGEPRSPHSGRDYKARAGTPVLAVADGVVALIGHHFFGGKSVFVDHGDGLISMSMHLSAVFVKQGDTVRRGQKIGAVGSTGRATGPHLHFGLRWHGARVDPDILLGLSPIVDVR